MRRYNVIVKEKSLIEDILEEKRDYIDFSIKSKCMKRLRIGGEIRIFNYSEDHLFVDKIITTKKRDKEIVRIGF